MQDCQTIFVDGFPFISTSISSFSASFYSSYIIQLLALFLFFFILRSMRLSYLLLMHEYVIEHLGRSILDTGSCATIKIC